MNDDNSGRKQNTCGRNLQRLRQAKPWNQEAFGKSVGLGRDAIAKIEIGTRCVTDIELKTFSKVLGCSLDALLADNPQRVEGEPPRVSPLFPIPSVILWEVGEVPNRLLKTALAVVFSSASPESAKWTEELTDLGASHEQIASLEALFAKDAEGNLAIRILGEKGLPAEISRDGTVEIDFGQQAVIYEPSEKMWMLECRSHSFRGIRSAIESVEANC